MSRLEDSNYTDKEKDQLRRFKKDLLAEDLSLNRINGYIARFLIMEEDLQFPLHEPTRQELKDLVITIQRQCKEGLITPNTRSERKQALRKFYQHHPDHDANQLLDFMTVHVREHERKEVDPDRLPRLETVDQLRDGACNPRDKAFFTMLFDSGGRIGEILPLTWDKIQWDKDKVQLFGKTGYRKIPLHYSIPLLRDWYDRLDPDSDDPVFPKLTELDQHMRYRSAYKQIHEAADRTGLPDHIKINPHAFRKARACDLAAEPHMNVDYLCRFFGWNSYDTARYYIKLTSNDMEEAFRQIHNNRETSLA